MWSLLPTCGATPLVSDGISKEPVDASFARRDGPAALADATPSRFDAAVGAGDGGGCQCVLGADLVLRMSWACFCAVYGCSFSEQAFCDSNVGWSSGCGLDVYAGNTIGGLDEWVFDHQSGEVVGVQLVRTDGVFQCPTDPTLQFSVVAAGRFPDAACTQSPACGCTDAGPPCPVPDSGVLFVHP